MRRILLCMAAFALLIGCSPPSETSDGMSTTGSAPPKPATNTNAGQTGVTGHPDGSGPIQMSDGKQPQEGTASPSTDTGVVNTAPTTSPSPGASPASGTANDSSMPPR